MHSTSVGLTGLTFRSNLLAGKIPSSVLVVLIKHLKKLEDTDPAEEKAQPADSVLEKAEVAAASSTPLSAKGAHFIREFVSKTERDRETHPLDPFEVARFRLLAAIVGVSGNDDNSLGPHDANLLFQHHDQLSLSHREMSGLVDCGLDNISHETVPLWHWYVATVAQDVGYLSLTSLVGPPSQRLGALVAMRLIGEPIKPLGPAGPDGHTMDRNAFISSWLSHDSNERLKTAALQYLSVCGEMGDLPILKKEYEKRSYQTAAAAADAIIRINLRQSREKALRALIELQPETIDEGLVAAMFGKPASLETSLLLEGTTHRNGKVRACIVPILVTRNALPMELAEKLIEDSEARVRFEALRSLKRNGREFPGETAKSILVKPTRGLGGGFGGLLGYAPPLPDKEGETLWEQFHRSKLRSQPQASFSSSEEARTILDPAERFALDFKQFRQRAPALRAAIDDHFQKEFEVAIRELEKLKLNADTLTKLRSLEESLRKECVRNGIDLLCEKNEQEDLERVRRVVSSGFVPVSTVDIEFLKNHGEWQDIHLLVSLLDRSEGTTLAGGFSTTKDLMRSQGQSIRSARAAFSSCANKKCRRDFFGA
jgi:hypothetical protein